MKKVYLVTGSAGFIGFHLAQRLLQAGESVVGLDNLNDYYSVQLKKDRTTLLKQNKNFSFYHNDLNEKEVIFSLFKKYNFQTIFHLAAQAGVRYSLDHPEAYLKSNIDGSLNILEATRYHTPQAHLLMASSSSVYGLSTKYPLSENDPANEPVALYGATKKANEMMAHSYCHLFQLQISMLRFFTVYGPWGRPDMALFKFVKAIQEGQTVELYNRGDMIRDFTFVSDIVDGILALDQNRQKAGLAKFEIFNIGCANPRTLKEFLAAIEKALKKKAQIKELPFQAGDIYKTFADVHKLQKLTGYQPKVQIEEGIQQFVDWYCEYYKKN